MYIFSEKDYWTPSKSRRSVRICFIVHEIADMSLRIKPCLVTTVPQRFQFHPQLLPQNPKRQSHPLPPPHQAKECGKGV